MALAPCPTCARHVRATEPSCPFCRAAFDAPLEPGWARHGVSRAMLVFGTLSTVAGLAGACKDGPDVHAPVPMYGGAPPVTEDSGYPLVAPSASAANEPVDAAPPLMPPTSQVAIYGAPPPGPPRPKK